MKNFFDMAESWKCKKCGEEISIDRHNTKEGLCEQCEEKTETTFD